MANLRTLGLKTKYTRENFLIEHVWMNPGRETADGPSAPVNGMVCRKHQEYPLWVVVDFWEG